MITKGMQTFYIGSIGFAQLGQNDYFERMKVEREIMFRHLNAHLMPPEEFRQTVQYKWAKNPHDLGTYYDLQILYPESHEYEVEENDDNMHRWDRLVTWMQKVESYDWEGEEIEEECRKLYMSKYPMNIIHKKDEDDDMDELMRRVD